MEFASPMLMRRFRSNRLSDVAVSLASKVKGLVSSRSSWVGCSKGDVLQVKEPARPSQRSRWDDAHFTKRTSSSVNQGKGPKPKVAGAYLTQAVTGRALPWAIQVAIAHLTDHGLQTVYLFRMGSANGRVQALRRRLEALGHGETPDLADCSVHDVACLVLQFFREMPEALITPAVDGVLLEIWQGVERGDERLEAVKMALLTLPHAHREALHALLGLLAAVSRHAHLNLMTTARLAACFAQALFHAHAPVELCRSSAWVEEPPQEACARLECLRFLIENHQRLLCSRPSCNCI